MEVHQQARKYSSSKTTSLHPWNEPIQRLLVKADELKVKLTTPMIGEPVIVGNSYPAKNWWLL